ncbi:CheR family methyltransferase [Paludibaculum fermentans]|uniref:protein-glutamate O-methyltransferase n=1 Tax=Paludibaculum fermentans TaxID=1473598 RepID=A0A7S7NNE1_PALFE|nr:protein-glutamate O-methyltransferase CheR [Paludibaculum fermentans]QOY86730.1 protein-glutamate O-methyltransferase CheR [Paludibaculum fermentans]
MPDISVEQFQKLSQQIYQKLGLHFDDRKFYFLRTRVARRMASLGIDDPKDYLFMLSYADPDGLEMQALANLVTTNETYMFREYDQLQAFANHCLPEVLSAKQERGERTLRIWSAGCSSGEEPYTLAMILQEVFPQAQTWDCEIVASDIDENMLRRVEAARYGPRSVNEVPDQYREKYLAEDGGEYVVRRRTAGLVRTLHLNLSDRMAMRAMRGFDFIFCRNVLIYFDDLSRKAVVDHFYNALRPGGFIFLGHSESVGRVTTAFTLKRFENHLVYVKE